MKIKHFAGYGTVTAKKISLVKNENDTILSILVTGDHEQGLIPHYIIPCEPTNYSDYTIKKWLIDKFDKSAKELTMFHYKMIAEPLDFSGTAIKYTFAYSNDGSIPHWM